MNIPTKAAIYSGIVFPGAGYFIVHCKKQGLAFIATTLFFLTFIIYESYYKAQIIAQNIVNSGVIPTSINQLREQLLMTPGILSPTVLNSIYAAIIFIWIFGIIDSYRIGKKLN